MDKAVAHLREKGLAAAAKKAGRDAREGLVSSYIHTGGRVGVLIEVNCETDFVARTDEFQKLARDLAMQVAGLAPVYVDIDRIPAEVVEAKKAALLADEAVQAEAGGRPREDRRRPAQEVVPRGLPPGAAVPRRGPHRPRPRHREDRHDRREHPGPPLRPLRARGGAVTEPGIEPVRARGRRRLPPRAGCATAGSCSSCPARRCSASASTASTRRSVPSSRNRSRRSTAPASRSGSSSGAATSSAAWPPPPAAWTAPPATTSACWRR